MNLRQVLLGATRQSPCRCTRTVQTAGLLCPGRLSLGTAQRMFASARIVSAEKRPPVQDLPERTVYDDFSNILAHTDQPRLQVNRLTATGLILSDGLQIVGPCLIIGGQVFLWNVPAAREPRPTASESSTSTSKPRGASNWSRWRDYRELLKVLEVVSPRPDILLFGTGASIVPLLPSIKRYITDLGIQVDVMDSRNAGSTYNLLAEEGRRVAAAILPTEHASALTGRRES